MEEASRRLLHMVSQRVKGVSRRLREASEVLQTAREVDSETEEEWEPKMAWEPHLDSEPQLNLRPEGELRYERPRTRNGNFDADASSNAKEWTGEPRDPNPIAAVKRAITLLRSEDSHQYELQVATLIRTLDVLTEETKTRPWNLLQSSDLGIRLHSVFRLRLEIQYGKLSDSQRARIRKAARARIIQAGRRRGELLVAREATSRCGNRRDSYKG